LHLMREAGNIAEEKSSRKITLENAKEAITKIDQFTIKKSSDLTDDEQKYYIMIKIILIIMPTNEDVMNILKGVNDPEIGIDIVTLELIYNVNVENDVANVKMTFTTPMCPYGPMLVEEIKTKVRELDGVKEVNVEVVFDPPWKPSEELRATLGV